MRVRRAFALLTLMLAGGNTKLLPQSPKIEARVDPRIDAIARTCMHGSRDCAAASY
jgi:hypothetical protein